jgi:hypothetical protein
MSFDKDEEFAKIGKRVQLHDYEDDNFRTSFAEAVPAGIIGQVIHANLDCRFTHEILNNPAYIPCVLLKEDENTMRYAYQPRLRGLHIGLL